VSALFTCLPPGRFWVGCAWGAASSLENAAVEVMGCLWVVGVEVACFGCWGASFVGVNCLLNEGGFCPGLAGEDPILL